jgi:DNA primase
LHQVLDYYHETLKRTPKALEYLESRGLMHPELISHFKLGFADYSFSQLLPQSKVKAGAAVRDQLKQIGMIRANGQAHFLGGRVSQCHRELRDFGIYRRSHDCP